jgi:hypothetical protein
MRPTTPKFNFAQHAGPSSPPATPTTTDFPPSGKKARRHGIANFPDFPSIPSISSTTGGTIIPNGTGTTFSYNRFEPLDLSPRSSSPASSVHDSSEADDPHPRSRSASPVESVPDYPPKINTRIKVVEEATFTLEEFRDSDYAAFDSESESIIRPHHYEDAESDHARSARASSPRHEIDPRVINGIRDMDCGFDPEDEDDREAWLERMREEKRRRRRSSGSVQKRSLAQSIGSDTDDEDLKPVQFDANEAGSSARRLRRKVAGERTSLIFDDPPVGRIEEEEEPESCEELVELGEVDESDEDDDRRGIKEMPFYVQVDMDIDSDED